MDTESLLPGLVPLALIALFIAGLLASDAIRARRAASHRGEIRRSAR